MAIKLKREHLKKLNGKYKFKYTWDRDKGDGEYTGILDQIKVDKDEGYEVLYFIQSLMNKHALKGTKDVHSIENALHMSDLSSTVMREDLEEAIEIYLDYI